MEMRNRIRDLREDMDLRQSDLAEKTGIDQRTISNYETGKTAPTLTLLSGLPIFSAYLSTIFFAERNKTFPQKSASTA